MSKLKVLNVGGGASRHLPSRYNTWEQHLLDIDKDCNPDICCNALEIKSHVAEHAYDAVYCSHNLEHFHKHEVPSVLGGFLHALKPAGLVEIHTPNVKAVFAEMSRNNLDINDVWYRIEGGAPVTFHDVLYGWDIAMSNGNLFYAHKCGFTALSLSTLLHQAGFVPESIVVKEVGGNLEAYARKYDQS